ncbi:hypothetical protein GCM10007897_14940 [Sphingobium jiangsuense]|uniref:Uncharacterized protein n=1 Tax=Sphingobium jiangsuense TaxID=870476 RepID=A0A7W6FNH2_9SPHN|nr:hypothetical protein [Sphingobium jiangsuense]MBB3925061.1 hypothetical protein [Sphingobium jiangsuense]GLT00110.1 hypothetical protein GCM10007897_14940 [Sphingobium jiangsuense]
MTEVLQTLGDLWRQRDPLRHNLPDAERHDIGRRATEIGHSLNAAGGYALMRKTFDQFERAHGENAGGWLALRWDGIGGFYA